MTNRRQFRMFIVAVLVLAAAIPGAVERKATAGVSAPPGADLPGATLTYTNASPVPIPDGVDVTTCVSKPGAPAISTITIGDSGIIKDVNVSLDITHPWVGDVSVELVSPSGTIVVLVDRPGFKPNQSCGYRLDDIRTVLDDESGGGPVKNANPPTGPSYTPEQPLSAFDGEDLAGEWVLRVYDHAGSDTGTLRSWSLIVEVNDAPVAVDDTYTTSEDTPLTVVVPGVLGNDTDVEGDTLTAGLVSGPAHGTLTLYADGSFIYTPDTGWLGTDSFTYAASDGTANSNPATVTLTVTAAPAPIPPTPIPPTVVPTAHPAATPAGPTAADHARAQAPLCADLNGTTSAIIRADVPAGAVPGGSVFCRVIAENGVFRNPAETARVGVMSVLERGVIQAVDIFGLLHNGQPVTSFSAPFRVCLQGQGVMVYLDATTAPRTVSEPPAVFEGGYTCATIPHAGMVVLVPAASSSAATTGQ